MAFQFPASPLVGQIYNPSVGIYFRFNGTGWVPFGTPPSIIEPLQKNMVIGGDFSTNPWQRGVSLVAPANGAYTADQWRYGKAGVMVHTVSKSADAPTVVQAGRLATQCLLIDCTTIDAAIAAADFCTIVNTIEGYNFLPLAQLPTVLSFWHKHTKTGIYCVGLRNSGVDRSYVFEYTQAVADTWERSEVPILASPSAGTWDYTTGSGIIITFSVCAGTNFHTTANAWNAGNFFATANQVNGCDNVANNFRLALVQLELGQQATPFEIRTFKEELVLCQRYYEKSFAVATAPAQALGVNTGETQVTAVRAGALAQYEYEEFKVNKRAAPTMTFWSANIASIEAYDITVGATCTATAAANVTDRGFRWSFTGAAGTLVGDAVGVHWTATAEL